MQTSTSFRRDEHVPGGSISFSEILSALSYALDLTEGSVPGHALRSCLLGMRIGAEAKLTSVQAGSLHLALLLKDAGRSSSVGWSPHGARRQSPLSSEARTSPHSNRAANILRKLGLGEAAAEAVRSLDERWDGSGYPHRLTGERIPLLSRICAIAQHLDRASILQGRQAAVDSAERLSGTWFDPQLVRIARSLHQSGLLWHQCGPQNAREDTQRAVLDLHQGEGQTLPPTRIDQICEAFAELVDAKSHFTFRHSMGVADAAFSIAQNLGMRGDRAQLVRRAALLHDIGKLSISNRILDKKTGLDAEEWRAVYRHPSVTRNILERVASFREIAVIAGEHHEKLDGSGYPHRLQAAHLSLESRIVSIADVYGALSEDRPYRPGLMLDEILAIMSRLVPHQLDADCFDALVSAVADRRALPHPHGPHLPGSPFVYAI